MPALAVALVVSLHSRFTPTRFASRYASLLGFALAAGGLSMQLLDHALIVYRGFFQGGYEAMMWSHFGVGILASLCLAPLAAAGLLRLRSA